MTYREMNPGDMLQPLGGDAHKWADAFAEHHPEIDKGFMIGWFANAMMNMWDTTLSNITHSDEALADHISALVRNRDMWRELDVSPNITPDAVSLTLDIPANLT